MQQQRVLVVEDDSAIRQGIVDALKFADYEVLQATNGNDGMAQGLRATIDLLMLDLILPGSSGFDILKAVRAAGAGVQLIPDGDIAGVIWTTDPVETAIDIYLGSGGAPEGVLAAAALRCIGGQIQGRLMPSNDEEAARAAKMGISDIRKKFKLEDMASSDVIFAATGVTSGSLLEGVKFRGEMAETETLIMRSKTGTVRRIKSSFRDVGRHLSAESRD